MIVGCGEWGFRELPMEEHFRICQRFGFKWLEFGIGGGQAGRLPEQLTEREIAEFRGLGKKYRMQTPFCCLENDFTLPDADQHERMLERTCAGIRLAGKCGATHVRLFAGFTPAAEMTEQIWQRMLDAFTKCDRLCQELEMEIAIETHGKLEFVNQVAARHVHTVSTERQSLQRLLRELPRRVGFNYDPGNLKPLYTDDPTLCLDLLNDRINYCHLKDWRNVGDNTWTAAAIGDDDIDYRPIFQQMKFDGVYLIEYEPLEDTEDGIRRSLDYLKKVAPGFVLE